MTAKMAQWFDRQRTTIYKSARGHKQRPLLMQKYMRLSLLSALGRVIYTTARIKGKETRVRIWIP